MTPIYRALIALTLALSSSVVSGCLMKDVSEAWYVDTAGAVTWVVHEQNVRSDAQATLDRRTEENEYWLAVQQERHQMAEGFRELRGDRLRTVVLRPEPPYFVQTEARFPGLDVLGQRLIAAIGTTGTSLVRTEKGVKEWTLIVRDPSALGASFEPSDGVGALLEGLEHLKVVLVTGTFESAEGFTISRDRRMAAFSYKEPGSKLSDQPSVALKLSWRVE